jgi:hypothetical protein
MFPAQEKSLAGVRQVHCSFARLTLRYRNWRDPLANRWGLGIAIVRMVATDDALVDSHFKPLTT